MVEMAEIVNRMAWIYYMLGLSIAPILTTPSGGREMVEMGAARTEALAEALQALDLTQGSGRI